MDLSQYLNNLEAIGLTLPAEVKAELDELFEMRDRIRRGKRTPEHNEARLLLWESLDYFKCTEVNLPDSLQGKIYNHLRGNQI